jgi:hypothetical protein
MSQYERIALVAKLFSILSFLSYEPPVVLSTIIKGSIQRSGDIIAYATRMLQFSSEMQQT